MEEFLGNTYVLVDSENFEHYLIFLGIGYIARKVALTLKQSVRLSRDQDGRYKFEFMSPLASSTVVFTSGEEFEEVKPDGVKVKAVITIEDNVMTHTQTDDNGKTSKHVREYYADRMITTTTAEGMNKVVKRHYVVQRAGIGDGLVITNYN